jgi:hypothetical protein
MARIAGALLLMCHASFASSELQSPTGEFLVGMRTFEIVDSARATGVAGHPYRIMPAYVFYPAEVSGSPGRPYLDPRDAAVEIPSMARNFHYTLDDQAQLSTMRARSVLNARPLRAAAKIPIVVFSHGFRSYPLQNTVLFEDLASHGYIVITLAHSEDSVTVRLQSGIVVPTFEPNVKETSYLAAKHEICCAATLTERAAAVREFARRLAPTRLGRSVGVWREDVLSTLRLIRAGSWPAVIEDVMRQANVNNVALAGMSFGGDVAAGTCRLAPNCRAAINLDGWPYDVSTIDSDVDRPFLMISSDWTRFPTEGQPADPGYNPTDLAFEEWKRAGLNPDVIRVRVDGIRHMGLTDLLSLLGGPSRSQNVGDADPAAVMTAVDAL